MNNRRRLPTPTRAAYQDYVVRVYFGVFSEKPEPKDWLRACVERAYRDFNRTLHKVPKGLHEYTQKTVIDLLTEVRDENAPRTQHAFDEWHRRACDQLVATYNIMEYKHFTYGHAQKWLNMALKYVFVLGTEKVPGFQNIHRFCHAPLDGIILKKLTKSKEVRGARIPDSWSKMADYSQYRDLQELIRREGSGAPPLTWEYWAWLAGRQR